MHEARLVDNQFVQHCDCAGNVILQAQQLGLRQQRVAGFRLGGDCPVDFLLGAGQIGPGDGETGVGQQRLNRVRRHLLGFDKRFLGVFRPL